MTSNWEELIKNCPHTEKRFAKKVYPFGNEYDLFFCKNCGVDIWEPVCKCENKEEENK